MFSYTPLIRALRQLKISSDLFSDQVQLTLALKMKHNFSKHLYRQQREKVLQEENSFLLKSKKPSYIPCFFMGYVWNEYKQTYNQTASAKCLKSRRCHIASTCTITVCCNLSGLLSKMIFLVYIVQSAFSSMDFILSSL